MNSFRLGKPVVRDFNFFEGYYKSSENRKKQMVTLIALAGFVLFGAFCVYSVYYVFGLRMEALRFEINVNKVFLSSTDTINKLKRYDELNGLLTELRAYNEKIDRLTIQIESNDFINTILLRDITANMPKDVNVEDLSFSGNIISLRGFGANEISVAEFEHSLAGLDYVDSVFVSGIFEQSRDVSYSFAMSIKMKDVPTDAE